MEDTKSLIAAARKALAKTKKRPSFSAAPPTAAQLAAQIQLDEQAVASAAAAKLATTDAVDQAQKSLATAQANDNAASNVFIQAQAQLAFDQVLLNNLEAGIPFGGS